MYDRKKLIKYSEKQGLDPTLELHAALKSGPKITEITIDGIFSDDFRCGPDHVGNLEGIRLENIPEWIEVKRTAVVPEGARSLHIFFTASGLDDTARLYIDQVDLFSPEME